MLPRNWQKLPKVDSRLLEYTNEYGLFPYLNIDFISDPKINLNYTFRNDSEKQTLDFFLNYIEELVLPIEHDIKTKNLILYANAPEHMMLFLEVLNQYQPFINTKNSSPLYINEIQEFINQGFHFYTASMLESREATQRGQTGGSYQYIYNTFNNNLPPTPYNSPMQDVPPSLIDQAIENLRDADLPLVPSVPIPRVLNEADIQHNIVQTRENLENELSDLFEDLDVEYDESEEEPQNYLDEKQNQDESPQSPRLR